MAMAVFLSADGCEGEGEEGDEEEGEGHWHPVRQTRLLGDPHFNWMLSVTSGRSPQFYFPSLTGVAVYVLRVDGTVSVVFVVKWVGE